MKTVSTEFLNKLKTQNIDLIKKLYIYHQYAYKIKEVNSSAYTVTVDGNATSLFTPNCYALVPLKDFTNHIQVLYSNYHVESNETIIDISIDDPIVLDDTYIGKDICVEIYVTDRILKDGYKNINMQIEGTYLNDFDSGSMEIQLNNEDGYFYNKTNTGLLNSNDIFWCRYDLKIKGIDDVISLFGGILENDETNNNAYDRVITIRVYGHSKELERYPASYVVNEGDNLELIKISGLYVNNYGESEDSQEGIKSIKFTPFGESELNGVSVESVSYDTEVGIHKLEFRYPNYFKWDNGEWVQVVYGGLDEEGNKKLYAYGNVKYAVVNFGINDDNTNTFPDTDTQLLVMVIDDEESNGEKKVTESGKPLISFGDGEEVALLFHPQRVLYYDAAISQYSNFDWLNYGYRRSRLPAGWAKSVFLQVNDEIIISSPDKFYGIDVFLKSAAADGDVFSISYSIGGNLFSEPMNLNNNGLVDGTNGLKNDGKITWVNTVGWNSNTLVLGDLNLTSLAGNENTVKGYMIKIKQTTHISIIIFYEIRKLLRIFGVDRDYIDVSIDQYKLYEGIINSHEGTAADELMIRYDSNNTEWKYGIWYENISIKQLLDLAFEKSNYDANHIVVDDIKIIKDEEYFNIWGKPPRFNYHNKPSALYYDKDSDYIYMATESDLWRCHITGVWEHLCTFPREGEKINLMWKDGDYIYCQLDDENINAQCTMSFMKYNILTGVMNNISGDINCITGRKCIRDGGLDSFGGVNTRCIGTGAVWTNGNFSPYSGGENLCIPYRQRISIKNYETTYAYVFLNNLIASVANFIYYFIKHLPYNEPSFTNVQNCYKNGPLLSADYGYYAINSEIMVPPNVPPRMGVTFGYNQQGFIFRKGNGFFFLSNANHDEENSKIIMLGSEFSPEPYIVNNWKVYDRAQVPICYAIDEVNDIIYSGRIVWDEHGSYYGVTPYVPPTGMPKALSYSYITEFKNTKNREWSKVWKYNKTGGMYTDYTADVNAGGSAIPNIINEVGDILYLGEYSHKFNQVKIHISYYLCSATYAFEYWNGTSWEYLESTGLGLEDSLYGMKDNLLSFTIPNNWVKLSVNGSDSLYYIRLRCVSWSSSSGSTIHLESCYMTESVLWDSETYGSGAYKHYTPTWMLKVGDNIYGCMFNKNSAGDYPFQWCVFVYTIGREYMVFSHAGSNFTFDGSYSFKDFIYNEFNQTVYCIAENIRHKDKPSFLVKVEFTNNQITLTSLGSAVETDWGNIGMTVNNNNGNIYGITRDKNYILWEYAKEFYMRVEIAKFDSDSIRDVIGNIAALNNCNYIVNSERTVKFIKRESDSGSTLDIKWGENMLQEKPNFENWKHYYDSIVISYNSLLYEASGQKRTGFDGWMKKVLSINNALIQNIHSAKLVSIDNYNYFNILRLSPNNIKISFLPYIECLDKVSLYIPSKVADLDTTKSFKIIGIEYSSDENFTLILLERIV